MKNKTKILIWRNGKLGNTIVIVPFILALRKALPDCSLTVILESLGADLLAYYPEIDKIIIYNKRKEHASIRAHIKFLMEIRKERFTYSIHLKRFFRNAFLSWLAGIPNRIGFITQGKSPLLTAALPYNETVNIIENNLSLFNLLNLPIEKNPVYKFYSSEGDKNLADIFIRHYNLKHLKFVLIHCGGETFAGRIPPSLFTEIIKYFLHVENLVPVLIQGPGDESSVLKVCQHLTGASSPVICQEDNIRVLAEIMRKASVFIGNNSGHAHLAALVKLPEIVLYMNTENTDVNIKKWKPWNEHCITVKLFPLESHEESIKKTIDSFKLLVKR